MNNIRLEKTIKYMCTAKNKVDEIIKDIEDNTEEFATEKSVMLIATTTE